MNLLTDILCTVADLVRQKIQLEAKCLAAKFEDVAKSLHKCAQNLCFLLGMLIFYFILLAAGVGFIMWGAYALLASAVHPGFAALIIGVIVSLIAITVLGAVKHSMK